MGSVRSPGLPAGHPNSPRWSSSTSAPNSTSPATASINEFITSQPSFADLEEVEHAGRQPRGQPALARRRATGLQVRRFSVPPRREPPSRRRRDPRAGPPHRLSDHDSARCAQQGALRRGRRRTRRADHGCDVAPDRGCRAHDPVEQSARTGRGRHRIPCRSGDSDDGDHLVRPAAGRRTVRADPVPAQARLDGGRTDVAPPHHRGRLGCGRAGGRRRRRDHRPRHVAARRRQIRRPRRGRNPATRPRAKPTTSAACPATARPSTSTAPTSESSQTRTRPPTQHRSQCACHGPQSRHRRRLQHQTGPQPRGRDDPSAHRRGRARCPGRRRADPRRRRRHHLRADGVADLRPTARPGLAGLHLRRRDGHRGRRGHRVRTRRSRGAGRRAGPGVPRPRRDRAVDPPGERVRRTVGHVHRRRVRPDRAAAHGGVRHDARTTFDRRGHHPQQRLRQSRRPCTRAADRSPRTTSPRRG